MDGVWWERNATRTHTMRNLLFFENVTSFRASVVLGQAWRLLLGLSKPVRLSDVLHRKVRSNPEFSGAGFRHSGFWFLVSDYDCVDGNAASRAPGDNVKDDNGYRAMFLRLTNRS